MQGKKIVGNPKDFDALQYPVEFAIKIIMTSEAGIEKNIGDLNNILNKFAIRIKKTWSHVESSKGNYVSYTGVLTIDTKSQMYALYGELSRHPDIKYAI
jgi:putative lipoic acid-binding regulatory protein